MSGTRRNPPSSSNSGDSSAGRDDLPWRRVEIDAEPEQSSKPVKEGIQDYAAREASLTELVGRTASLKYSCYCNRDNPIRLQCEITVPIN